MCVSVRQIEDVRAPTEVGALDSAHEKNANAPILSRRSYQSFCAGPLADGVVPSLTVGAAAPAGRELITFTGCPNVTLSPLVAILMLGASDATVLKLLATSIGVALGPAPLPLPAVPIDRTGALFALLRAVAVVPVLWEGDAKPALPPPDMTGAGSAA